jgi:transposase
MATRGPKPKRNFSKEEFVSLWSANVSIRKIGERLGASERVVSRWAKRFGLPPRKCPEPLSSPEDTGALAELMKCWVDPDMSAGDVAAKLNVNRGTLHRWVSRYNLGQKVTAVDLGGPGPGDPTPDQIEELKAYANARRVMQKGFSFEEGE